MDILRQKQLKNMVERILHVPGGYSGGILEMALICDYHMPGEELKQITGDIVATLKKHSEVFRNVRLNFLKWIDDEHIVKEVIPMAYVQMGTVFGEDEARGLEATGPKSLEELTRQLKLFCARSKLVIVVTDGSYCIGNIKKVKEHFQPFLHRKMMLVQGEEMFTGTQLMMDMEQKMAGTVVFDMDGVLFDTERIYADAWIAAAGEYGYDDVQEAVMGAIGRNAADTRALFIRLLGEEYPYDAVWDRARELARQKIEAEGIPVMKGVRELLEYLKGANYRIGLASSTRKGRVLEQITEAGIADYFEVVVGGDMVKHSKPDPEIYLIACKELGVKPEDTYAIEDSPNGIRSAHGAGMMPLMVPDMIVPTEEIKGLCTGIFEDLCRVKDYLMKM